MLAAAASFIGFSSLSLPAAPSGASYDPSQVSSIDTSGGVLTVTTTAPRTVINWDDFSIAAGEGVHFAQPSGTSAVLNRVTGLSPSTIDGTLSSNGAVYLINPNGVAISSTGVVDTAGFVASTLDVADKEFLAGGVLDFYGDSTATVTNAGTISVTGGNAFLISQQVVNTGTISADGTVGIAAGSEVLLYETSEDSSQQLYVLAGEGTISNQGLITAASAELKAAGGNTFALAINNEGTIRATTLTEKGGRIILVTGDGTITNTGELTATGPTETSGSIELHATTIADTGITQAGSVSYDSSLYIKYLDPVAEDTDPVIYYSMGGVGTPQDSVDFADFHPVGYNYRGNTAESSLFQTASLQHSRIQADLVPSDSTSSLGLVSSDTADRENTTDASERPL